MTQAGFKTCFISAPLGIDTSVLRQVLDEKEIRWFDQTKLEPGNIWIDAVEKALSGVDFICMVLPEGQHGNTLFELGIAYARKKPILVFLGTGASLPSDILSLTYVRADPKNLSTVRSAIGTFLKHASDKPQRKTLAAPAKRKSIPKGPRSTLQSHGGQEFEQVIVELLREAGFILSEPTERRDQGADLAVWIDELQQSLGNPLLVQVKAGDLSTENIHQAASQLRHSVAKTHGNYGLLVYWDRQNREFPTVSAEWPVIFQLSRAAFTRLLRQGRLPEQLIRLRNAAVHRKG